MRELALLVLQRLPVVCLHALELRGEGLLGLGDLAREHALRPLRDLPRQLKEESK